MVLAPEMAHDSMATPAADQQPNGRGVESGLLQPGGHTSQAIADRLRVHTQLASQSAGGLMDQSDEELSLRRSQKRFCGTVRGCHSASRRNRMLKSQEPSVRHHR